MEQRSPALGWQEREGVEERSEDSFVRFVLWVGKALDAPCFTGSLSALQTVLVTHKPHSDLLISCSSWGVQATVSLC